MICSECKSEMSKKWNPSAAKAMGGAAVTWSCGVCGYQLLQEKTKLRPKDVEDPLDSIST